MHSLAVHVVVHRVARDRSARPDPLRALLLEAAVAQAVRPGLCELELGRELALDLDVLLLGAQQRGGGERLLGDLGGLFGVDLDEDDEAVKAVALAVPAQE